MIISYKTYVNSKFPKHCNTSYYLTLNGVQIGSIKFSLREVELSIARLKAGALDWDKAYSLKELYEEE